MLHVSTRSTNNRRLSGGRDSSEPRRANARAELKTFRVFRGQQLTFKCKPSF